MESRLTGCWGAGGNAAVRELRNGSLNTGGEPMRYRRIRPGVGDPAGATREVGVRGGIVSQRLQRHEPALEIPETEVSGGASRTRGASTAEGGERVDARAGARQRACPPGGLDGAVGGWAGA